MRVNFVMLGRAGAEQLPDSSTVRDLLKAVGLPFDHERNIGVYLNSNEALPDDRLSEGDTVGIFFPIEGGAPIPERRDEGIAMLRDFTSGAQELIILDPYLLTPSFAGTVPQHLEILTEAICLDRSTLKRLHIVFRWWEGQRAAVDTLSATCRRSSCQLTWRTSSLLHDRFWVRDRNHAKAVGTSLNAFGGRRLAFVLDLPAEDLDFLLAFLTSKNLL